MSEIFNFLRSEKSPYRVTTKDLSDFVRFVDLFALGVPIKNITTESKDKDKMATLFSKQDNALKTAADTLTQSKDTAVTSTLHATNRMKSRKRTHKKEKGTETTFPDVLEQSQLESFFEVFTLRLKNQRRKAQLLLMEEVEEYYNKISA